MDYADKLPPNSWDNFTPPHRYIISPPLTLRHAKAHFDLTEQPEPLDLFLLTGWPRLLEERLGTLQLPVPDEEPPRPDVGKLDGRVGRFGNGLCHGAPCSQQHHRDRGPRSEGQGWQSAYRFVPLYHRCTTSNSRFSSIGTASNCAMPDSKK